MNSGLIFKVSIRIFSINFYNRRFNTSLLSFMFAYNWNLKFLLVVHRIYILLNISAQSWLSVPPAPAWISRKQSSLSFSLDRKHLISFFLTSFFKSLILIITSFIICWLFSSCARWNKSFSSSNCFKWNLYAPIKSSKDFLSLRVFSASCLFFQKLGFSIFLFRISTLLKRSFLSKKLLNS